MSSKNKPSKIDLIWRYYEISKHYEFPDRIEKDLEKYFSEHPEMLNSKYIERINFVLLLISDASIGLILNLIQDFERNDCDKYVEKKVLRGGLPMAKSQCRGARKCLICMGGRCGRTEHAEGP
jgi:hypothetical protein